MRRSIYEVEHNLFSETVRNFVSREVTPHYERWEKEGIIDRSLWESAGRDGLLGLSVPERYGGAGEPDYRFRTRMIEEMCRSGADSVIAGINTQEDVVLPYLIDLGTEDQKQRWLPGMCTGHTIGAIAMTEPNTGSDLQGIRTSAVRSGDDWILNGQKTFITNGIHADLVIVVAKTDPASSANGMTLFVVEDGEKGFNRGRNLEKVGLHGQDTAELFFDHVRLPSRHVLGMEGHGFSYLMQRLPRERLAVAVFAVAAARTAYEHTVQYCFERRAFGQRVGDFQNTRFVLAEIATELDVAQFYLDAAVQALNAGELTAVDAAKAKLWSSELQLRIVDRCVQLHGGYGYMLEYPVARSFIDSRVQTIYGGTSEIMKEIIGRDLANQHG